MLHRFSGEGDVLFEVLLVLEIEKKFVGFLKLATLSHDFVLFLTLILTFLDLLLLRSWPIVNEGHEATLFNSHIFDFLFYLCLKQIGKI